MPVRAAGSTSDAAQTAAIRPATRPAVTINVIKSINGIQPDVSELSGINVFLSARETTLSSNGKVELILCAAEKEGFRSSRMTMKSGDQVFCIPILFALTSSPLLTVAESIAHEIQEIHGVSHDECLGVCKIGTLPIIYAIQSLIVAFQELSCPA